MTPDAPRAGRGPALDPHLVAHRGWTEHHAENTLEAIRAAIEVGCRAVEFDVRRTADAHWVVYHDADLRRLHGVPHPLLKHPLAELRRHAPLPLLAEVLEHFRPGCLPMIEIKQRNTKGIDALLDTLMRHASRLPMVAISRGRRITDIIHSRLPYLDIYLYGRDWQRAESIATAAIRGFDLEAATFPDADATARLARLQSGGRKVAVWTINDPDECRRWLAAGAAWVITDVPWRMA